MSRSRPWWELYPEVLRAEEADLERLGGTAPVLNEALLAGSQVRQYEVPYTDDHGIVHDLTVTYADFHPYFRVEVTTTERFRTHQQPFLGNLCLLRGETWDWDVSETAAELIRQQMPKLLVDQATPGASDADDANAISHVDPFVGYFTYQDESAIRVDGAWPDLTKADAGTLTIKLDRPAPAHPLRGTVTQVADADGTVLRAADSRLCDVFAGDIPGRWCRLDQRPPEDDPAAVLQAAVTAHPDLAAPSFQRVGDDDVDVLGVVFPDGTEPGVTADAWLFVVRGRSHHTAPTPKSRQRKGGRYTPPSAAAIDPYLARAYRAGPSDMTKRIPTLQPLDTKHVAVLGVGGIGAPAAIEFAKAGVGRLSILDCDTVDPGNAARWPLGYQNAGMGKARTLLQFAAANWPYTQYAGAHTRLGTPRIAGDIDPEWESLLKFLDGVDLIADATAEIGINYFLSDLAKDLGVPYIVASATEGGWGGMVARFDPAPDRACWSCLMHHFTDGTLHPPPADPDRATGAVWPAGCTDPTFTGTGFDIAAVALAAVRVAAATLCHDTPGGHPPANWDYARYTFRDADYTLPGTAETFTIEQHPDCGSCATRRSG